MPNFSPTDEQLACIDAATNSTSNLQIVANAGAAKTSTLELIANALPTVSILSLAFNKKIAEEMTRRMPSNVKAMTLNGLGHRTWMEASGRRLTLETSKNYNNLTELIKSLSDADRDEAFESLSDLIRLVGFGKQCGYIPDGVDRNSKRLMDDVDFFNHVEQKLSDSQCWLIAEATRMSIRQAHEGLIDFDDQIFMPTLFQGAFPRYPLVLVDEAQDLSALNHATMRKLVGTRRLIAVGDPAQAIYGFRGAHEESMSVLAETFDMTKLTLSTTFRCPRKVVEHARWRAPNMKYPDWAIEGSVAHRSSWSASSIPDDNAMILCRNNAPLFRAAIRLLTSGRHVEVGGTDVVKLIIKIMSKFGDKRTIQPDVLRSIDGWEAREKEKTKSSAHGKIADQAECMRVFANAGDTLGAALDYAHHIMNSQGPLKLLTIHQAKGLEAQHVFILDQELISRDDQDPNLRYVAQTRTKETLTYITTEGYEA